MAEHTVATTGEDAPRSFEERVFARFNDPNARFGSFASLMTDAATRLASLEAGQNDMRLNCELGLVEITQTKGALSRVESKVNAITVVPSEIKGVSECPEGRME